jgi:hypothetical protein
MARLRSAESDTLAAVSGSAAGLGGRRSCKTFEVLAREDVAGGADRGSNDRERGEAVDVLVGVCSRACAAQGISMAWMTFSPAPNRPAGAIALSLYHC